MQSIRKKMNKYKNLKYCQFMSDSYQELFSQSNIIAEVYRCSIKLQNIVAWYMQKLYRAKETF